MNKKNFVNKNKIVPSYEKSNKDSSVKNKKLKSKITLILVCLILIIILLLLIFGVFSLCTYFKYKKYNEYNEKIIIYGFDKMYDNQSLKVTDNVTKSEAIKMIVSSVLNVYDISSFYSVSNVSYDNQIWVEYAKEMEWLKFDVNTDNEDSKVTLMECLNILSNIKTSYLSKSLDVDKTPSYADFEKYTNDDKTIIKDMVYNGILEDNDSKLSANKAIKKGQLNSILIKFVEKYNLITVEGEKLNINEEKLPYNQTDYPYILASVNKEIYQKRFYILDGEKSVLPVDFFADNKDKFISIKYLAKSYFDTILNIDYNSIDKNKFKENISECLYYTPSDDVIDKYIEYVKNNKIVTSGTSKVIYPVIYFDGVNIRARVCVSYSIKNSDTYDNVFLGDLNKANNYNYYEQEVLYVDITLKQLDNNGPLKIVFSSIKDWSIGKINVNK